MLHAVRTRQWVACAPMQVQLDATPPTVSKAHKRGKAGGAAHTQQFIHTDRCEKQKEHFTPRSSRTPTASAPFLMSTTMCPLVTNRHAIKGVERLTCSSLELRED